MAILLAHPWLHHVGARTGKKVSGSLAFPIQTAPNDTSSLQMRLVWSPCNVRITLGARGGVWVCSNYSVDSAAAKQTAFTLFASVFQKKKKSIFMPLLFPNLGDWSMLKSNSLVSLQLTSSSLPSILRFLAPGNGMGARSISHHCATENKGDLSTARAKDARKTVSPCSNMQNPCKESG